MTSEPVTLPVHCAHCHGAVTLQFHDWPGRDAPALTQAWVCPYCQRTNLGGFPGLLAWVTKREDDSAPVI
jgi:hypothetical protein